MLFEQFDAIRVGPDPGQLFQQGGVPPALGPASPQGAEIADLVQTVEIADPDHDLAEDLGGGLGELRRAVQDGPGELIALLDVGAFVSGPGALQALDQRGDIVQPGRIQRDGLAQQGVAGFAIPLRHHHAQLIGQPGRLAVGRRQVADKGFRARHLPGAAQHHGLAFQQPHVARIGGDRLVDLGFGLLGPVLLTQHPDHVEPGVDGVRLDRHGLTEAHQRRVELVLLDQGAGQLALVFGIAGIQAHQPAEHRLGLHALAQVQQHIAVVLLPARVFGRHPRRLLQHGQRLAVALQLAQIDAAHVQQVKIAGMAHQRLSAERLAFVKSPGGVELDGQRAIDLHRPRRVFGHGGDQMPDRLIPPPTAQGRLRRRQPIAHAQSSPRRLRVDLRPLLRRFNALIAAGPNAPARSATSGSG